MNFPFDAGQGGTWENGVCTVRAVNLINYFTGRAEMGKPGPGRKRYWISRDCANFLFLLLSESYAWKKLSDINNFNLYFTSVPF